MIRKKVLIIEDESRMRRLIGDYLKREGYDVLEAEDGQEGLDLFRQENIDLVILDIMLPKYDGWTVCREIRKESSVPVLMLTARSEESDELFGFELGADEYITKPFRPKILVARVKALLKRFNMEEESAISFEGIEIDCDAHKVFIDGKEIEMTPKEYELLVYLMNNEGKALTREQILDGVWGYDYYGDLRTVDTHIKRLRVKLKEKSNFVQTVRGVGYRFEVKK
ncbi:response regulator transcription factor [Crassaminicella thermophila]|uniref:Stage 0 sporulation protein A homolog n=1 Tax=Crassaminicella thermophila TaxID=2599308 RepID=A0A5C0SIS0_CRATE|nr:response regulator transcription factor [Crassaminicella thermophila]QEK13334.1 response regulator transcription factor [Crassaminicella thermophila]